MTRRPAALVAAWGIVLAGLTLVGPATPAAVGHSQLVTSVPAAGEVVAPSPTEIRLVFSEPIEAAYSKLDLLDATGSGVASGIGAPDPDDPYTLVAPVTGLADGIYTVQWRALSAADGHTTSGFFTFGVGNVTPPAPGNAAAGSGSIHAGHDAATAFIETESRIAGNLGLLLAVGLAVIGWLVLRDRRSAGLAMLIAASLGLAAFGAAGLLVLGGSSIGFDPLSYVAGSRTGQLLFVRVVVCGGAAVLVAWLARRRSGMAIPIGGLAGLAGLVGVALGGHAAAYDSPAPAAAIVVHLVAAGIWLAGIAVLAWLAVAGTPSDRPLSVLAPRFSGLALVSVGLIALTGVYSDWIQTRTLVSLDTPYSATLIIKAALALGAFTLGAFNYFSGGREADRGFRPRVLVECGLALAVLIATGVLASGSPPAQEKPVAIAAAPSSVTGGVVPPILELAPGRPGPTRYIVSGVALPDSAAVELHLQRLDGSGASNVELEPTSNPGTWASGGGLLPADSRWDASVVVRDSGGDELSRTRFAFALDDEGVSEGRAAPAIDPAIIVGITLLVACALGVAFSLGGGSLPRADPSTSRVAVLFGSAAGAIVGVLVLFGGPRL